MHWAKRSTRVLTGRENCITLSLTESHSNTARLPPFFSHSHFSKSSVRERSWSSKSEKRRSGKSARTRFQERVSMQKISFGEKSALLVAPPDSTVDFFKTTNSLIIWSDQKFSSWDLPCVFAFVLLFARSKPDSETNKTKLHHNSWLFVPTRSC